MSIDLYKNEFQAGSLVRFQPGSGKLLAVVNKNVIGILEFPSFIGKIGLKVSFTYDI